MKFVKDSRPHPAHDLTPDITNLGPSLELIHHSQLPISAHDPKRACWAAHLDPRDSLQVLLQGAAPTILQSDGDDFREDVKGWVSLRENPGAYFQDPLRSLMPGGADYTALKIAGPHQKENLRQEIITFASARGNAPCVESVVANFEELFMNAMLDAPREARNPSPSTGSIFFLAADERRLGIACQDPHGSLNILKLLNRMSEVYEQGAGAVINLRGPGGAGLGCTIMMENSALICFGVRPDQSTVVSCLVHRHLSYRRRAEIKKSLHLVTLE